MRIQVKELFDLYQYEYDAIAASMDLIGLVESDNEGGIIRAGLQLLTKYSIDAVQVPAGEHVPYVERQIRTIKRRTNAMQISIPFKLNAVMLQWLVVNVVNWNNMFPKKGSNVSPMSSVYCKKLLYTDVMRAPFGQFVMAHRPVKQLVAGQAYGELGMSCGFNPKYPGSIFFLSLETGFVKARSRFVCVESYDGCEKFGQNLKYQPANPIKTLAQSKLSMRLDNYIPPSPDQLYSPIAERRVQFQDEVLGSEQPRNLFPIDPIAVINNPVTPVSPVKEHSFPDQDTVEPVTTADPNPVAVPTSVKDPIRDYIPPTRVQPPRKARQQLNSRFQDYKVNSFMYESEFVVVDSCSWSRASQLVGEDRAELAAHMKEVRQAIEYNVFEPVLVGTKKVA